ncbi:alpha/beta fold hydrolase [Rhodovulum euryhalinum]|uniref:Lysophospholipase n=1 Tax=Rhodovulum euryhalinum TaxID=35805 RepID=A0A4R2KX14_9RHOB|nr:alpha/beta hydrolase [Rhodovulum euryhalinum]TCO71235.1 lysophospholipase [Rhodovulum euryhalinum]
MDTAPLYNDIAEGPEDAAAYWVTAGDGVRIRIAVWGAARARATVLLFPGRTEYAEKYGRSAADLAARGFATVVVDWRGQGLADRLHDDPVLGHVDRFEAYQRDVTAVARAAEALGLPRPYHLLAHSMGGCIGLRALHQGLDVASVAFTAPMWGIRFSPLMRPAAWALSAASRPLGFDRRMTPGRGGDAYILASSFDENELTGDPEMFGYMRRQLAARPEMAIGGPSLSWLHEALCEMRALVRMAPPAIPALTYLGTDERIVCANAIRTVKGSWAAGTLREIEGARHEVMMEGTATRARVFDEVAEHFTRHATPHLPHRKRITDTLHA